jgi:hypothetical protein
MRNNIRCGHRNRLLPKLKNIILITAQHMLHVAFCHQMSTIHRTFNGYATVIFKNSPSHESSQIFQNTVLLNFRGEFVAEKNTWISISPKRTIADKDDNTLIRHTPSESKTARSGAIMVSESTRAWYQRSNHFYHRKEAR